MSKTRDDLIKQALVNLGLIAEGQAFEAEMVQRMDKIIDPALAKLAGLDIYYVSDQGVEGPEGGEIEDSAFLPIANYVAEAACPAFNLAADTKMQVMKEQAIGDLRTLAAPSRARRFLSLDPATRPYRHGLWPVSR